MEGRKKYEKWLKQKQKHIFFGKVVQTIDTISIICKIKYQFIFKNMVQQIDT